MVQEEWLLVLNELAVATVKQNNSYYFGERLSQGGYQAVAQWKRNVKTMSDRNNKSWLEKIEEI